MKPGRLFQTICSEESTKKLEHFFILNVPDNVGMRWITVEAFLSFRFAEFTTLFKIDEFGRVCIT